MRLSPTTTASDDMILPRGHRGFDEVSTPLPSHSSTATIPATMTWKPWTFFAVAIAGWMNRQQQEAISYLRVENQILREKLGHKRILLNTAQKRRLAVAAMKLPRDLLRMCGTLFSPETILKWNRMLIASKYDGSGKRGPKPKKANSVRKLVKQMSEENPSWGYGRICGELRKLGFEIHWQTVRRVMLDLGRIPIQTVRTRPHGRPSSPATGRASPRPFFSPPRLGASKA
jgi:hypothetical protein